MRIIIIILTIIVLVLSVLVGLKVINDKVRDYSVSAVHTILKQKNVNGIELQNLGFKDARYLFPVTLAWAGVNAQARIKDPSDDMGDKTFSIQVDSLQVNGAGFMSNRFIIKGRGLDILPLEDKPDASKMPLDDLSVRLEQGEFEYEVVLEGLDPYKAKEYLRGIYGQLNALINNQKTQIPLYFSGILLFRINQDMVDAVISTKRDAEGNTILQINKEVFKTLALYKDYKMTDADAQLLSVNPFKIPKLIQIMTFAKNEAEQYEGVGTVPVDAYRHVLWSYSLTKEFGPKFAEQVTDAHEKYDFENTEAEHRMDYNNNAVGRQYALKNVDLVSILERIVKDPDVILKAD